MSNLTTGRWLNKSEHLFYIADVIEKIAQESEIQEATIKAVKNKLTPQNWVLIGTDRLLPEIKEIIKTDEKLKYDDLKQKMINRWIITTDEKLIKNIENDVNNLYKYLYDAWINNRLDEVNHKTNENSYLKLLKELIVNIILLEWYKETLKNTADIKEVTNNTNSQLTEWMTD